MLLGACAPEMQQRPLPCLERDRAAAFVRSSEEARVLAAANRRLQGATRRELRNGRGRDVHLLPPVPRVDAHAGLAVGRGELAETGEAHRVALPERFRDRVEHGVDGLGRFALAEAALARDLFDELLLCHLGLLLWTSWTTGRYRMLARFPLNHAAFRMVRPRRFPPHETRGTSAR